MVVGPHLREVKGIAAPVAHWHGSLGPDCDNGSNTLDDEIYKAVVRRKPLQLWGIHVLEDSSLLWGGDPSMTKFPRVLSVPYPSANGVTTERDTNQRINQQWPELALPK